MDYNIIPSADITASIASSTTNYLIAFSPIILFVGSIILAVALVQLIIDFVKDMIERDRILTEYTELRGEEAYFLGREFGSFEQEKEISRTMIRPNRFRDSVGVTAVNRDEALAENRAKQQELQREY